MPPISMLAITVLTGTTWLLYKVLYNQYFHPLSRFPGPTLAGVTSYWKAWVECVQEKSFCHELVNLHAKYGPVVRVAPNELHFSDPHAYHDIYNSKNRWDKQRSLYHSFGEDRSSFGFLTYREAKARKDIVGRTFSPAAIAHCEPLLRTKVDALCAALAACGPAPVDLFYAFRCMSMDVITYLAFGQSAGALAAPGFAAPILTAMDAASSIVVRFKHSAAYKHLIMRTQPVLAARLSPATRGLIDLQTLLRAQIHGLLRDPARALEGLPHNMTIFHRLMDPAAYKAGDAPPGAGSLYEEAQALMFGGTDTVGTALMVGAFHLLREPRARAALVSELREAWPVLDEAPTLRELEKLPYLDAVIRESLRMSSGVVGGLPRVVPPDGAVIVGTDVPGGTVVSIGSTFVHNAADIFTEPFVLRPERWLEDPDLDNWLVAFSRGPRMCLGISLAWAELRLCFAHFYRGFDMQPAESHPAQLQFRDTFLPQYYGEHVKAYLTPVNS